MSDEEKYLFDLALKRRLSLSKAYRVFDNPSLYHAYRIHISCRPTLKRLAALQLFAIQPPTTSHVDLLDESGSEMPISLAKEMNMFCQSLWTVDVFFCKTTLFEFTPALNDPREAVDKEMALLENRYHIVAEFTSVTPDWSIQMDLWVVPKLFNNLDVLSKTDKCIEEILSKANRRKLKIVFLKLVSIGMVDSYLFTFLPIHETLDYD